MRASKGSTSAGVISWLIPAMRRKESRGPGTSTICKFELGEASSPAAVSEFAGDGGILAASAREHVPKKKMQEAKAANRRNGNFIYTPRQMCDNSGSEKFYLHAQRIADPCGIERPHGGDWLMFYRGSLKSTSRTG